MGEYDEAGRAYERYRSVRFFGSLNGVRCLCILAVMWHHSPARSAFAEGVPILGRGFAGVDFFFVLSGFLITTLLLREEARDGRFSLRGFYWRRSLRIIPAYFLLVTCMAAYFIGVQGQWDKLPLLPYYYLFLSNMLVGDIPLLTITWSLSVEEQYYLIWPTLLLLLPAVARTRLLVLGGLIVLCFLSAEGLLAWVGLRPVVTEHAIWRIPVSNYQPILIGSLVAMVLHGPRGFAWLYRVFGAPWMPLVTFPALVVVLQFAPGDMQGWPNLLMHGCMALCLVSVVIREDHRMAGLLAWAPVARIGEISYGLYLYHLIGRHFGVELTALAGISGVTGFWVATGLFVLISIAMAEVSFRTFERYFLDLKSGKSLPGAGSRASSSAGE